MGDASLSGLDECTISVDVMGAAVGSNDNTTSDLSFAVGLSELSSGKANATLEVTADTLHVAKSFVNDPVLPGATVDLEFTVTNFSRDESATAISFTDDLDETLTGLEAIGLPASDVCGDGSTLTGTSLLTLSGGSLGPGESCTFTTTLQLPTSSTGVFHQRHQLDYRRSGRRIDDWKLLPRMISSCPRLRS